MKYFSYAFSFLVFWCSSECAGQWSKNANLPASGRDAAYEFSIGNKIYFGGGYISSTQFWEYDPIANTWAPKANIPTAKMDRAFGISFSIGTKGYVAFGQSIIDANSFSNEQASVTNDLWQYDPATNTWARRADLPGPARDGAMVFVVNGKAYAGAGVDSAENYLGDFYEYDPIQDKWTQKADVPGGPIGFPITFAIGNMGYMVGGAASTETTAAYAYDPSTDTWSSISPFGGTARQAGVGFTIDSLGYIGLGQAQYATTFSDFYTYNSTTDTWAKAASGFPDNVGWGWASAAVIGHSVFIGGGAQLPSFNYPNTWYSYTPPMDVPSSVSLIAPPDMSTITATPTMFQWQSVSGTTTYVLEVSASSTFTSPLIDSIVEGNPSASITTMIPGQYYWRVAVLNGIVKGPWSTSRSFTIAQAGIAEPSATKQFGIRTSPNPFTNIADITVNATQPTDVVVRILDVLGRPVETLNSGMVTPGSHSYHWDASEAPQGSYYLEVVSSEGTSLERIELMR